MTTTTGQDTTVDGTGTDRPSPATATPARRAALGLLLGAVFAVALAVRHVISADPDITWDDIGWRAGIVTAVVTFVFALIPARLARRSWAAPRRAQTPGQRIGILLACVVAVALVAMRSYRWMGR